MLAHKNMECCRPAKSGFGSKRPRAEEREQDINIVDIESDSNDISALLKVKDAEDSYPLSGTDVMYASELLSVTMSKLMKLRSHYVAEYRDLCQQLRKTDGADVEASTNEERLVAHHHSRKRKIARRRQLQRKPETPSDLLSLSSSQRRTAAPKMCPHHEPALPRCREPALPSSKYCLKHINHDPKQRLFPFCAAAKCNRIVFDLDQVCCGEHSTMDFTQSTSNVSSQHRNRRHSSNTSSVVSSTAESKKKLNTELAFSSSCDSSTTVAYGDSDSEVTTDPYGLMDSA